MFTSKRWVWLPAIVVGWLLTAAPAQAVLTAEVRDQGGFFKPETVREANEIIM